MKGMKGMENQIPDSIRRRQRLSNGYGGQEFQIPEKIPSVSDPCFIIPFIPFIPVIFALDAFTEIVVMDSG